MRNFQLIGKDVDVLPILAALNAHPELWNADPIRSTYPGSPHAAVDDILCMWNDGGDVVEDIQTHPKQAWHLLPIRDVVLNLMRRVNGTQLGRVVITRLAPGNSIASHADHGAPATFYQRHQLMLQCEAGCIFRAGNEALQMQTGEVWWFDNTQLHEVVNNSASDRIALIVDVRIA